MTIIVLGTLGDLVKKITELELIEETSRKNTVKIQIYYKVLAKCPVSDKVKLERLISFFKMYSARFRQVDSQIDLSNALYAIYNVKVKEYFQIRKKLKELLDEINKLSLSIDDPIEVEVD